MTESQSLLMLNPRPNSYLSWLDEVALLNIFKRLQLYDLLQIGELDVNYQQIIGENIISKQKLDIGKVSKHYDTRHTFKQFGPFVTSLVVHETDIQYKDDKFTFIDEIFRLIQKRCTVGRLLSIEIHLDRTEDQHTVTIVPDVFKGIFSLIIDAGYRRDMPKSNNLLGSVISKCLKLNSLTLKGIIGNWDFLVFPQLQNLLTLTISNCRIPHTAWANFVTKGIHCLSALNIWSHPLPEFPEQKSINENFVRDIGRAFPKLKSLYLVCDEPTIIAQNICDIQQSFPGLKTLMIQIAGYGFTKFTHNTFRLIEQFLHLPSLSELEIKACLENETITAIVAASRNLRVLKFYSARQLAWKFYDSLAIERSTRFPDAQPLHMHARFKEFVRHKPNVITIHRINWYEF